MADKKSEAAEKSDYDKYLAEVKKNEEKHVEDHGDNAPKKDSERKAFEKRMGLDV